jgi:hypothetical protein
MLVFGPPAPNPGETFPVRLGWTERSPKVGGLEGLPCVPIANCMAIRANVNYSEPAG